MAIDKDVVPRETPPVNDSGPILTLDPDQLEDRLARMSEKDRKKLLDMLDSYQAVMLKR
tara:strand:- start:6134 stop:6310 length:177 start_codon:yes stop_codon:yes gene_type:complete